MLRFLGFTMLAALTLSAGPLSGRRAPSFALPDSTAKIHDILDYRGKVLLVEFMQTTCPHCITLSGTLEAVKTKFGDKLQILSVVVPPDSLQMVANFIAKHKTTYPILFDCGQVTSVFLKISPQNPTVTFPHMFIIDPQGNIVADYGGEAASKMDAAAIGAVIEKAMGSPAPAKK